MNYRLMPIKLEIDGRTTHIWVQDTGDLQEIILPMIRVGISVKWEVVDDDKYDYINENLASHL